jgi:hypothetical protein
MNERRRQRGAALLLLLVIAVMAFTAAVVSGFGKWSSATTASRNTNAEALAQAKTALIGYVAKEVLDFSENVPGRLPCPESAGDAGTNNEGRAAGNCGSAASPTIPAIGRLPWRTLGVDKLVDASAEPLWYAVSPKWVTLFAIPPVAPTINDGTPGDLAFDGTGGVVAVIFAPGPPLSTSPTAAQLAAGCVARNQARSDRSHVVTGGDPDYRDYLECQNASAPIDSSFGIAVTDNAISRALNDQAVVITAKDVLNAIQGPLAERLQRTVAPLLSEYGDQWIGGSKFMPYAVAFSPPEAGLAVDAHCGTAGQSEGLLPIASTTSALCASTWTGAFSGDGINSLGCTGASPAVCSFNYYRLNALGQLLFGIVGATSVTATLQASAPHAAASFRAKSVQSTADVTVTSGAATLGGFSIAPKTSGDVDMSLTATVSSTNLCKESLVGGLLCSSVAALGLASTSTVSLQFPQLATPSLAGSKLTTGAKNGAAGPFNLLSPAAGDPHYWFVQNQWYRYTYYAVAPSATAAQTAGSNISVNLFPASYGSSSDKRFVLALMGPAVTGQARSATAAMNQYVEGQNAVTGGSPRTFAFQVYTVSGNDRLATCPFTSGSSLCD